MPQWYYVGTTTQSKESVVKKRLRSKHIGYRTKRHPAEIGDGIYGKGTDFYVSKSRYYEAENLFIQWEEQGTVLIITTAVASGI